MDIQVDPDWWETLFDEVYLLTDARSVCDEELTRRETDVLCELLPIEADHSVLDLCGGQGRHSMELAVRGHGGCTVLDYSRHLIDLGKSTALKRGITVRFLQGDARSTGLPDGEFDHVIIMGNSMGYLPDPRDDLRILKEASRVMRPGSWILIDVVDGEQIKNSLSPNAWHEIGEDILVCRARRVNENVVIAREIVLSRSRGLIRDQSYSIRYYCAGKLQRLLLDAGFREVRVHRDFSPHDREGDFGFMNRRMIFTAHKPPES